MKYVVGGAIVNDTDYVQGAEMYCANCKFYKKTATAVVCARPSGDINPVTGVDYGQGYCAEERQETVYTSRPAKCGPDARYFERNWWPVVGKLGIVAAVAVAVALWVSIGVTIS